MVSINALKSFFKSQRGLAEESIWANVFHDTAKGIEWLGDMSDLSPGHMAVGYNYLYVMTRILDEIMPNTVLDIGLGLSSTLFSKYFYGVAEKKHAEIVKHLVIEHDEEWIKFYTNKHHQSDHTEIIQCPIKIEKKKGEEYWAYDKRAFLEAIGNKKFSIISVDGPFGFVMKNGVALSPAVVRCDIVDVLPDIVFEDFVIVMDDYDTRGVKNTVRLLTDRLNSLKINTHMGVYHGRTDLCVIASEGYRFLCSC